MKKTEEERKREVAEQIEIIKEELEKLEYKIRICPAKEWNRLRKLCSQREVLEWKKYQLTNLYNTIY